MKKVVVIFIISLLMLSCTSYKFNNFNKQKFTHLKTKCLKTIKPEKKNFLFKKNKSSGLEHIGLEHKSKLYIIQSNNKGILKEKHCQTKVNTKNITKQIKYNQMKPQNLNNKIPNNQKKTRLKLKIKKRVFKRIFSNQNHRTNGLYFFLILLGFPFLLIYKLGYRIAIWANQNLKKAQFLVGIFSVLGIACSFLLGTILEYQISTYMYLIPLIFSVGSFMIIKVNKIKPLLKRQLSISLLSTSSLFLSFGEGSNSSSQILCNQMSVHPILAIFLTIIIIGLLALSIYGLAALSCQIACAGAEVLAGVIFFGGSIGFISLAVFAIYRLFRKKDKNQKVSKEKNKVKHLINERTLIGGILFLIGVIIGLLM